MTGASPFPRHWIYDAEGELSHKSGPDRLHATGTASRSAGTPRGATRTPRRWSPRWRRRWSGTLSVQLMRGAAKPTIRAAAGRATCWSRQGEPGHRRLPAARRRDPGRAGRRAAGRVRAGRACSGSGPTSRAATRTSTLVAVTAVPGGVGRRQPVRPAGAGGAVRRAPPGRRRPRAETVRVCTSAGSAARPRRPAPTSSATAATPPAWPSRTTATPGRRWSSTRAPACAGHPAARRAAVRRHDPAHPPALGPRARAAVLPRRATATTPGSPAAARAGRTAPPRSRCWPGACRRRTSRSGRASCAASWTFGTLAPGQLKAEGFTVEAREMPHKGGADVRLPGQRRALA